MKNKHSFPNLANGNITTNYMLNQEKEEENQKKQFRHDWLIACFSIIAGAISGLLTSIVYNLLF